MIGLQVQKRLPRVLLYGFLLLSSGFLHAQVEIASPDLTYKQHRFNSQIGSKLLQLHDEYKDFIASGELVFEPSFSLWMIREDQVKLLVTAEDDRTEELISTLKGMGLQNVGFFKNKINGDFPILAIHDLFGVVGFRFVDCEYHPSTKSGSVLSQGD